MRATWSVGFFVLLLLAAALLAFLPDWAVGLAVVGASLLVLRGLGVVIREAAALSLFLGLAVVLVPRALQSTPPPNGNSLGWLYLTGCLVVLAGVVHLDLPRWRPLTLALLALSPVLIAGLWKFVSDYLWISYIGSFDVPLDAVIGTSGLGDVIAASAVLKVLLAWALALGASGWISYVAAGEVRSVLLLLVFLGASFGSLQAIVGESTEAQLHAESAKKTVQDARQPDYYVAVQLVRSCVSPVSPDKRLSTIGGSLSGERPVLVFPPSGDRLWVWDPGSAEGDGRTVSLPANQVAAVPVADGTETCPRASSD